MILLACLLPCQAVVLLQIDDFSSGTAGWDGGQFGVPQQILAGGPGGGSNPFLQASTSEFHLGTKNGDQWIGNYTAAGITGIQFDANLMGPDNTDLRILLFGSGGAWATNTIVSLSPGSGWQTLVFSIAPDDLTHVLPGAKGSAGTGVVTDTLSAVTGILIRNDRVTPTLIGDHPPHITTVIGLDNITAIPEPRTLALLAFALLPLLSRRR